MLKEEEAFPSFIGPYQIKKLIGKGSFAVVYLAIHIRSHRLVAIKAISKKSLNDELLKSPKGKGNDDKTDSASDLFKKETKIMAMLDHPFIVTLYETMEDEKYFFIVMEYLENGTLLEYVNKNGPLSEDSASRVFSQLISVLDYLHNTMNIIHRDIKTENIMFDKNINIRIIDFGFSKILSSNMQIVTTSCGSPGYASPELISGFPYRTSSDIWSAGIVLYAMTTGSLPFQSFNTQRSIELIMNSDPQYPSRLSSILVDLLDKLLTKDPDLRITLDQIKEHPLVACWLHDCDYMKYALFDGKEADPQITQKLNILKYNTDTLTEDLKRHLRTPIATLYLIFKNEKTIEEMSRSNTCIRLPKLITEREDLRSTHHVLSPLKMKFAITKQNPNTKSLPQPKPVLRFEIPQPRQIANSPIVVPKIRRRERLNSADPELSLTIPRDWGSPLFLNKM